MNLRDIIDYKKLFTMIYSGVESETFFNVLYNEGIRDYLMSYHYIQTKNIDIKTRFSRDDIKLFVDSGAYTYQADPKYQSTTVATWEKHLQNYLDWARAHKDYIFAIANFDFENLVGGEKVKEWNKKYFEPFMLETGIPVCFVWHQNSALSWEQYAQRYPYIGISSVTIEGKDLELKDYNMYLRQAQKYNTVVHGFGMTKTSLLPKLPYYTVDSTTWLVGLQYGEINYWTGKKMSRLKKDKWHKMKNQFERMGINFEKLKAEEKPEMIRANIIAFIEAEKFIRDKLRNSMYWLKPERIENDLDDDKLFPPCSWLENSNDFIGWEDYAKRMNIGVKDKDLSINAVIDATAFCNWENEEYKDFIERVYIEDEETLIQVHDQYINQIRADNEERIEDLIKFFQDVVTGKSDSLINLGGSAVAKPKERDEYIEEDEFDVVEISKEEIKSSLKNILGTGEEDDIEKLEDEIFKEQGIVPVRDEKGKFLKGQKVVKKPKNIYSDKFPKLACNSCYAAQSCPDFEADMVCAYNKMFKRFDSRRMSDVIEAMQGMANLNLERMQRLMMFEVLDGGMLDGNLTALIDQNMRLLMGMKNLYDRSGDEVLRQTKTFKADGTVQETTELQNPQSGGILEKLFSSNLKPKEAEKSEDIKKEEAIDIDVILVED